MATNDRSTNLDEENLIPKASRETAAHNSAFGVAEVTLGLDDCCLKTHIACSSARQPGVVNIEIVLPCGAAIG